MKKIFSLILGVLFLLPVLVNADMGAPGIKPYKATVSNPDGASIYKYSEKEKTNVLSNEKIPYGEILEIIWEYRNRAYVEYNEKEIEINLSDITPIDKKYRIDKSELSDEIDAITLKKLEIRTGPAIAYESTGVSIAKNTKIRICFFKENGDQIPWVYVEYKETKGFINILEASVAFDAIKEKTLANKNLVIKDLDTGKAIGNIGFNTKLKKGTVYNLDIWSNAYYVTYNGVSGLVDINDISKKNHVSKVTTLKEIELHKTAEVTSDYIGSIPAGTTLVNFYDNSQYDTKIYYEDENQSGWIIIYSNGIVNVEDYLKIETLSEPITDPEEAVEIEESEEDSKETINEEKTKKSPREFVITCLVMSFILCLTGIVCLVLANKKKKNN